MCSGHPQVYPGCAERTQATWLHQGTPGYARLLAGSCLLGAAMRTTLMLQNLPSDWRTHNLLTWLTGLHILAMCDLVVITRTAWLKNI